MLWRKRPRRIYYSKTVTPRARRIIKLTAVIVIILANIIALSAKLRELTIRQAEWEISTVMTGLIHEAINAKIADGEFDYSEMITLDKDANGNVTALITNMSTINKLQADLINNVIALTDENAVRDIYIPLGNIIGGSIFLGRGPDIPIKIVSLTSVNASFFNEFSDAGINQTRHRIKLEVDVELSFLISGYSAQTTSSAEVIVAETVIVGNVPESYTLFEGDSGESASDYKYYAID